MIDFFANWLHRKHFPLFKAAENTTFAALDSVLLGITHSSVMLFFFSSID